MFAKNNARIGTELSRKDYYNPIKYKLPGKKEIMGDFRTRMMLFGSCLTAVCNWNNSVWSRNVGMGEKSKLEKVQLLYFFLETSTAEAEERDIIG